LVGLRRRGTVEDCANVIEFLATDLSGDVTGAAIPIDGGLVRGIVSHPPFPWRFVFEFDCRSGNRTLL
jgi:3-oxoacyl-[acyl-carrier protein] reductase